LQHCREPGKGEHRAGASRLYAGVQEHYACLLVGEEQRGDCVGLAILFISDRAQRGKSGDLVLSFGDKDFPNLGRVRSAAKH